MTTLFKKQGKAVKQVKLGFWGSNSTWKNLGQTAEDGRGCLPWFLNLLLTLPSLGTRYKVSDQYTIAQTHGEFGLRVCIYGDVGS